MSGTSGLIYKKPRVIGKQRFRLRETHIRDHIAPLIRRNALGAAKLDLVLRGIALPKSHLGRRKVTGLVLPGYSYEDLHDLCRSATHYGEELEDPHVIALKRKWVREQLVRLTALKLVHKGSEPGRPSLVVFSDKGTGAEFDDPDGKKGNSYLTILGAVIASGELASWNAPELVFYLAATIAEGYEVHRRKSRDKNFSQPLGGGEWFQPLWWFSDPDRRRPPSHVRVPFSVPTLERGRESIKARGLVDISHIRYNPLTRVRFQSGIHNLYTNRFNTLDEQAALVASDELDKALKQLAEAPASAL